MYILDAGSLLQCMIVLYTNIMGGVSMVVWIRPLVSTLHTPSFGNHLFVNYHVLKHPITNLILSSFYIPKVLKSAAQIMVIGSQIMFWTRAFSIVKMLPREVTVFPEKI